MRVSVRTVALLAGVLAIAACSDQQESDAPEITQAAPDAPAGITITDGRLNLPGAPGNPGAVYFSLSNAGTEPILVAAVHVARSGSAMLHETVEQDGQMTMNHLSELPVLPGQTVQFAPGGKHVMAMDLDAALAVGDTVEVTLTFANGDKASFPARVLAAGDPG